MAALVGLSMSLFSGFVIQQKYTQSQNYNTVDF
jgi:hypothetical protein